jgi:hypothetical protein
MSVDHPIQWQNMTTPDDDLLTAAANDDEENNMSLMENLPWVILWVCSLLLFACLPFCINKQRRQLCRRRIKERRWILDPQPDWYTLVLQRQAQRRQEMETQQQEFQISRTQEDEIREQFLLVQLETYTMVSIVVSAAGCGSISIIIYYHMFLTHTIPYNTTLLLLCRH